MGLGSIPKKAWNWLRPNIKKSIDLLHSTRTGASYARFMASGAVIGGIYGLADNMVNDRVSVMGGMMQGAMMGAGVRGVGSLWGMAGAQKAAAAKRAATLAKFSKGARNMNVFQGANMRNTPQGSMMYNQLLNRGRARAKAGYYGQAPASLIR